MIKKLAMAVLVSVSFSVFATDNNYIDGSSCILKNNHMASKMICIL